MKPQVKKNIPKIAVQIVFIIFCAVLLSCSKGDPDSIAEKDREFILQYIADNNLDAKEVDDTGIFYVIFTEGSGDYPTANSFVLVKNMGFYFDSKDKKVVFQPLTTGEYYLRNTLLGWQYGIPKFNRGAVGMLLIPSAYGYGSDSYYTGIPPDTVLFFDIELIDFS